MERGQLIKKGETVAILDGTVVNANLKIAEDKISTVRYKILRLELQKESISNRLLDDSFVRKAKIKSRECVIVAGSKMIKSKSIVYKTKINLSQDNF